MYSYYKKDYLTAYYLVTLSAYFQIYKDVVNKQSANRNNDYSIS